MGNPIPTLLLLALPAGGKSELRRYLAGLPAARATDFGLGRTVHLDDYPYVHLMRRISAELVELGQPPAFFASARTPFLEAGDWGTLIHLLNQDFAQLGRSMDPPASATEWLVDRLDMARRRIGLRPTLSGVAASAQAALADAIEDEAAELWAERNEVAAGYQPEATVIVEFARGGPEATTPPIPPPQGYEYSLAQLAPDILATASIIYVWVAPDQSRRRNEDRARPGRDGDASILHHGVPEMVMRRDYGMDDMMWLIEHSDLPGTVRVATAEEVFHLPVAVFDNRVDKTWFLRSDPNDWPEESMAELHAALHSVFGSLQDRPA